MPAFPTPWESPKLMIEIPRYASLSNSHLGLELRNLVTSGSIELEGPMYLSPSQTSPNCVYWASAPSPVWHEILRYCHHGSTAFSPCPVLCWPSCCVSWNKQSGCVQSHSIVDKWEAAVFILQTPCKWLTSPCPVCSMNQLTYYTWGVFLDLWLAQNKYTSEKLPSFLGCTVSFPLKSLVRKFQWASNSNGK